MSAVLASAFSFLCNILIDNKFLEDMDDCLYLIAVTTRNIFKHIPSIGESAVLPHMESNVINLNMKFRNI